MIIKIILLLLTNYLQFSYLSKIMESYEKYTAEIK